jgi:L-iditol 2-dehydrogenase
VKIRVHACSTCGTDAKIHKHGHHRLRPPRVLGHEVAGEIVAVGAAVTDYRIGDRVQVIAAIPCGDCDDCQRGLHTICPHQESIGYDYDGGFAEFLIVPEKVLRVGGLNHIPEGVLYIEASVAEPLACVINGQELAAVGEGDTVVVVGAGPIGCLHVRLARARGAAAVYLVELSRQRLDLAASRVQPDAAICAAETNPVDEILKLTNGRGADVVITAAASGKAQEDALQMAARRGRISFFGGLPKDNPIISCDSNLVHYRELTIVGANGSSPEHNKQALELIASRAVPVWDLITHQIPLDRLHHGIEAVSSGDAIKVTITPTGHKPL